jgi:RNase P subunit RPR2
MDKLDAILTKKLQNLIDAAEKAGYCPACCNKLIFGKTGIVIVRTEGLDSFTECCNNTIQAVPRVDRACSCDHDGEDE